MLILLIFSVLAFVAFFITVCYHTIYAPPWIFPPLAFYGLDMLLRFFRYRIKDATVTPISNQMTIVRYLLNVFPLHTYRTSVCRSTYLFALMGGQQANTSAFAFSSMVAYSSLTHSRSSLPLLQPLVSQTSTHRV